MAHSNALRYKVRTSCDQGVCFNSEIAHLADVNQRITDKIAQIHLDPSLSDDEKFLRKHDLMGRSFEDALQYSGSTNDIEETVKSLRNLLTSNAAS
jgi:hypothetical protein